MLKYYGSTTVGLPPKRKEEKGKEDKRKEKEKNRKEIVDIYNSTCTNLPKIQKITEKRNKSINNFLKEFSLEQFKQICNIANSSDFLTGNNDRGWKADFDFFMRVDKSTAVLEGKYNTNLPKIEQPKQETEAEKIARKTRELEEAIKRNANK